LIKKAAFAQAKRLFLLGLHPVQVKNLSRVGGLIG
jgi:hypothetical protein